ncbi:phage tail sheath family protein [Photorhabdus laumondii subsp. laumondii]|uniref:Photorhabdus luminescens subsp. laumondii TTO1 complete genome segment 6/17 n=2 Tax=Photorhabdus laumondii subsp. laumondii TaxID=141679 RepID=Q7N678_PHOLL|nr:MULTISPECIES: phage tail sheath C-terminal domain-containing protein [Photorhabdus]AWK41529.1 phage tail protein [Photorhabdus laumondii subsp. laumondii]AXG42329.1 phage tail sheath family protein [Photorhabdus laumondii subsp. laumondii]AXG46852.1 phage tail sheath family protein [Photorhabdus laumondii subsp. laumondii]KTL61418.1 phage tail protein [Photorhabdus laumondii subsp. laumondii]MCC8382153.1 phage tail sheath family protein [Photorhabdus laumondii]
MPTTPTYPGVYIEEDASLSLSISHGNTAIPVFIGRFQPKKASATLKAIRVSSWLDFTNLFNVGCITSIAITSTKPTPTPPPPPSPSGKVAGDTATADIALDADDTNTDYTYAINTVTSTTSSDALKLYFQNGGGPCYILSIADSGNSETTALLPELIEQALEITLIVCPEQDSSYQLAIYNSLPPALLNAGYFLIADSQGKTTKPTVNVPSQTATYYPAVKISQLMQTEDSLIAVSGYEDAASNEVKNLAQLKQKNSTVYQQAVQAIQGKMKSSSNTIPASAVMAGVYCATDASRGVWKAPANVVLSGISDVTERLNDDEQGAMNLLGINAIRYFNGRGFVVWGARTLQDDDNWRYIPVRRLFNSAERDIKQAMRTAVFEPNSQPTWERVKSAIDNYLYSLWQQGALAGNKPQEAYFVQIGKGITMSDDDIKQGKMIVKVGMAAVRPAEFIILQFSQNVAQ